MITGAIKNQVDQIWNTFWSRFKDFDSKRKFNVFRDQVFPFIKSLNGRAGSSYTWFMQDAVFIISNPGLLDKVTNMSDAISMLQLTLR